MVYMAEPFFRPPISLENASILNRLKEGYLLWTNLIPHIPRGSRYTIGARIENKFLDLLELSYSTYFSEKEKKSDKICQCILILDTLKFLLSIAWEAKLISHKQFGDVAAKLDEVGKMFGGWRKNLEYAEKKNRTL